MWPAIGCVCGLGLMLWAVIALAKNSGRNAARLEALKQEAIRQAQEQEACHEVKNRVYHLPVSAVRKRLQNLARK